MLHDPDLPRFYDGCPAHPDLNLGLLTRRLGVSLVGEIEAQLKTEQLCQSLWAPLTYLSGPGADNTVLGMARQLGTDAATMTRYIDKLSERGLLQRERSAVDRRVVHVHLTQDGQAMVEAIRPKLQRALNVHLKGFSHDEGQLLLQFMCRMLANGQAAQEARLQAASRALPES